MAPFLQVFVLGCLFGASVAAPLTKILEYDAGDHSRYEAGTPGQSVTGSFSWQSGDQQFHMDYIADEKGYRPIMKVTRIGNAGAKVQPVPYIQQIIPAVPAPTPFPVAPVVPVAPPAPVQDVTKIVQAAPEPVVVKVEVAPAKVEASPAVVAAEPPKPEPEPVKVEESVKIEAEPVNAAVPESDDDAIQVTAEAAAGDEPDQIKGTILMNALAQEYEQQLLEEQQYLAALAEAQQDERPSSYALTQEEEAELALLQLMQFEQELAKQIENQPDDQSSAVRAALEYEKQLAKELEQQDYLRQLAEAELLGLTQPSVNNDASAYLRQIYDYNQQQQLLAQLAGVDNSAYLRQLTGYEPQLYAQFQQQPSESIDGYTVNARELSDYEKALEALYFGGQ